MKPSPPNSLLGPGQAWIVVPAPQWGLVTDKDCNVRWRDGDQEMCRVPAVIADVVSHSPQAEILCERHMGSHRWIANGVVMQWRADPPWVYPKRKPRMPPRKREK